MKKFIQIVAATLCVLVISCSEDKKAVTSQKPVSAAAKLPQPFTFHKAIEVKPGLTLDVLSWGRGAESGGAYLILRSDSSHLKYRSTSGELDGRIQDAWNMDMDSDGNPELFIQAKGEGEGSYFTMYVYEFNNSGSSEELRFPDLTSSTKKAYRGMDSVYIKNQKLRREFPLFTEDKSNTPSGERKVLEYTLRNNNFSVKEIKDEQKEDPGKK